MTSRRDLPEGVQSELAAAIEASRSARPAASLVMAFTDEHRDRFTVEPICSVLDDVALRDRPEQLLRGKEASAVDAVDRGR
jgi:hypothetical protein